MLIRRVHLLCHRAPGDAEVSKSGDLGLTAGTYEASFKGPDGRQVSEKGKYVCTWRKQKGGTWKAIHDIWNADAK